MRDLDEYAGATVSETSLRRKVTQARAGDEEKKRGGQALFSEEEYKLLSKRIELVRAKMLVVKKSDIMLEGRQIVREREEKRLSAEHVASGMSLELAQEKTATEAQKIAIKSCKNTWYQRYVAMRQGRTVKRHRSLEAKRKETMEPLNVLKDLRLKAKMCARYDIMLDLRDGLECRQEGICWRLHPKYFVWWGGDFDEQPQTLLGTRTDEDGNKVFYFYTLLLQCFNAS